MDTIRFDNFHEYVVNSIQTNSVIPNMQYEKVNLLSKLISKFYIELISTTKTDCLIWYIDGHI